MHKIKKVRDNLIIQIGDVYTYQGRDYKVITAGAEVIDSRADTLTITGPIYHLKDIETGGMDYVAESVLKEELPKHNHVIQLEG